MPGRGGSHTHGFEGQQHQQDVQRAAQPTIPPDERDGEESRRRDNLRRRCQRSDRLPRPSSARVSQNAVVRIATRVYAPRSQGHSPSGVASRVRHSTQSPNPAASNAWGCPPAVGCAPGKAHEYARRSQGCRDSSLRRGALDLMGDLGPGSQFPPREVQPNPRAWRWQCRWTTTR